MVKRLRIERLQVHVKGVDAQTAEAAARLLGPALAAHLAASESRSFERPASGPVRLSVRPDAKAMSDVVARRVCDHVRARIGHSPNTKRRAD